MHYNPFWIDELRQEMELEAQEHGYDTWAEYADKSDDIADDIVDKRIIEKNERM
jgi:hypothetical protein